MEDTTATTTTGAWCARTISAWCGRCYGFTNQTDGVCHSCNDVVPTDDTDDLGRS